MLFVRLGFLFKCDFELNKLVDIAGSSDNPLRCWVYLAQADLGREQEALSSPTLKPVAESGLAVYVGKPTSLSVRKPRSKTSISTCSARRVWKKNPRWILGKVPYFLGTLARVCSEVSARTIKPMFTGNSAVKSGPRAARFPRSLEHMFESAEPTGN